MRQTQITSLSNSLDAAQKLLAEKVKEVDDIRPRVSTLLTQNSELGRANNDLQNQLQSAELAVRKLQEQIASSDNTKPGAAAPGAETSNQVTSLSAGNQASAQINGTVTGVELSAGRTLVGTGLGSRDNVKVDTHFAIYRDNKFIADAVVIRVTPNESVAAIKSSKPGETVQPGDLGHQHPVISATRIPSHVRRNPGGQSLRRITWIPVRGCLPHRPKIACPCLLWSLL